MRRLKLALLGSVFIIAACSHKTATAPPPATNEVAPQQKEMQPQQPTPTRETEEAKPGAIAPAPPQPTQAPTPALTPTPQPTTPPPTPPAAVTPQPKTVTVIMNSQRFSPAEVTVKKGDTVIFKNTGTEAMWPASAVHPSHDVYPEKGGCLGSKFDACRGVKANEGWSFTFNSTGSWGYHDHLSPGLRGKVIVE